MSHAGLFLAFVLLVLAALGVMAALIWTRRSASQACSAAWARAVVGDLLRLPGRLRRVALDPRTPRLARWLLVALALYIASPIDLVPDFVPILGQIDDLVVIAVALAAIQRMIPDDVWSAHFPERDPDGP